MYAKVCSHDHNAIHPELHKSNELRTGCPVKSYEAKTITYAEHNHKA